MADRKGTIVVTGANGGLGSAIAAHLAGSTLLGPTYYGLYTVRNVDSAVSLKKILKIAPESHKHDIVEMDLARLASVRAAAESINHRVTEGSLPPIRALILNAAYIEHFSQNFTPDGFDMTWQVNYLSHFLLTLLLLQSMDKDNGRVIIIGSYTHDPYDPKNNDIPSFAEERWKTLYRDTEGLAKGTWSSSKDYPDLHGGNRRYGASKACQIMMMYELQDRVKRDSVLANISVIGLDPGGMPTEIMRRSNLVLRFSTLVMPLIAWIMSWFSENPRVRTTERSARDVVRAVFDTESLGEHPVDVYLYGTAQINTSEESKDPVKRARLWRDSLQLTHIVSEDTILQNWN